ncbi:MAG TPA: histidine phosphatase family protein [Chloroflexota bacterium]
MNSCRRTDIYVVRHAHVHNPDDILYGRLPRFHLSDLGLNQANKLAAFLAGRPIEAIYSSPLLRARQTAGTIAQVLPGVPVRRSSLILEVRTGYEGEPNSILQPGFSFYEPLVRETDESMEAVYVRVSRFLRRIARRHAGKSVVAVTHADPIAIMRLGLLGLPFSVSNLHSTVYPARASINLVTLTPEQDPVLTYFNVSGERL